VQSGDDPNASEVAQQMQFNAQKVNILYQNVTISG